MNYIDIKGKWKNEFNSVMDITRVDPKTGIFSGTYSSTTGATGTYLVTGITDISPDRDPKNDNSQTIAFAVSWRDIGGNPDGAHWVSGFAGQLQIVEGEQVMSTTYLLQKNTLPADNWGATVVAVATFRRVRELPVSAQSPHVVFPLARGKLSDNGATPWTSVVGIGTPDQKLRFMLDSGTENTWVTSVQCTTNACMAHKRFDAQQSSSYQVLDHGAQKQEDFGPWGSMTVVLGADVFTLEHVDGKERRSVSTTEPMHFEVAIHYTGSQFQLLDCDGGIAIPSPYWERSGATEALMLQLLADGKIGYPLAAFWCDEGRGECTFGAVDHSKYKPETLQFLPLQNPGNAGLDYLWAVELGGFLVAGKSVQAGIANFVLDSGSSFFKGPKDLIDTLVNAVTDNGRLPSYVSSVDALRDYPVIALSLGQQTYELHPQQYFLKLNEQYWELGIQVLDGMPEGMLLVGSMFLETVYSIFDYGGMQVGLAMRK